MKTLAITLLFLFAPYGFENIFQTGETVTINQPVDHDMYVAGGTVIINAPIHGDLIVAGGTITINDSISQDLLIAGGKVIINGHLGDDIRCAGGTIQLSRNVTGDVVVAGGEFRQDRDAVIFGNLLVAGGSVWINGTVKGLVKNQSGDFELNGTVEDDLECRADKIIINGNVKGASILSANSITIGPQAMFNQNVSYWSKTEDLDFGTSLVDSKSTYDTSLQIKSGNWKLLGFASVLLLTWYLGTALLMIFVIQYLFGKTLRSAATKALSESLRSIGFGALLFICVPIGIVLFFVTIIGIPIGVILLFVYILLILFATALASLVIAHWINNVYYGATWKTGKLTMVSFGLFIILKMATLTPIIGPLLMIIVAFMTYGAIILTLNRKTKEIPAL